MGFDIGRAVRARTLASLAALIAAFAFATPAAAQQEQSDEQDGSEAPSARSPELVGEEQEVEEVVVTGSRLRRDTYTSVSPLQIITGEISREVGLIDAGAILQESTAAAGQQADLTFSGFFVADNGPGSNTVDLRGLGAERTLFLINGRRVAPAGIEGAPIAPDVNLIPTSLVQQFELLLDGASSVYGSDAVAGVVNVILRKDFDGLELELFSGIPAAGDSAGTQDTLSARWGYNGDRGFIGIGAEYNKVEAITLGDRAWSRPCQRHFEVTTDGEIRSEDLYYSTVLGQRSPGDCAVTALTGYVTELGPPQLGSLFYSPEGSNVGIGNLNDYFGFGTVIDINQDGFADVSFRDYNVNGNEQFARIIPEIETTSAMAYGEYTFSGEANITPYFELTYAERESAGNFGAAQLFPTVNPLNPFNPCNPNAAGGVDCGLAYDALLDNPVYAADFAAVNGLTPAEFRDLGIVNLYTGAVGPIAVQPVVHVRGDRNTDTSSIQQIRAVAGLRGDIPFMNFGSVRNWSFDVYFSESQSEGDAARPGIRGDRLNLALGNYSTTGTPCDNSFGVALASDTAAGCVPVNMFAPSLYANVTNNDFETQAERNYVFDTRDFRTDYRQTIAFAYASGDILELPAGDVLFGLGVEYREDEIESIPDEVARDGLFFGFFSDGGAVGEKTTEEFFAEVEVPVLANKPAFEELTVNLSSRYTKDEFYDGSWTYSGKLAWRPVDSLLLRGTVGTSYRAPNLRENFLRSQTGFLNITDPCVIPDIAFDPVTGYDPALDPRSDEVIANCVADPNVDPFTFVNNGIQTYSVEASEGGSLGLNEEESESWSAGFTWEQPFFANFDLSLAVTYYEIEIVDEIIEPSSAFIVSDCYNDPEGDSAFCSRITRDPADSTLALIDESFINRDQLNTRGVDINLFTEWPVTIFGNAVDLGADFAFNRTLEFSQRVLDGTDDIEQFQGEPGFPKWKGRINLRADFGKYRLSWASRYLSGVDQDADGVDEFSDVFGIADTCLGEANGDVDCRDVGWIDGYWNHTVSFYYRGDQWTLGAGLRNVFDEDPPFVDGTEVSSINNGPIGFGYDLYGRQAFINIAYSLQ